MRRFHLSLILLLTVFCGCRRNAGKADAGPVRPAMQTAVPQNLNEMALFSASLVSVYDTLPIISLLDSVRNTRAALDEFSELARQVWSNPNSPLRNDEFFIPVLRTMIGSGFYDEASVIRYKYQLGLLLQNRPGHRANEIVYTEKDGTTGYLNSIQSEFTLLYFNNPGCEMCGQVSSDLKSSEIISGLVENGMLTVLSVYPDEDIGEWTLHYDEQPSSWIRCYDRGCRIREKGLYNLEAIPSLYLLDRNKRVILKDVSDVAQIEFAFVRFNGH